VAAVVDFPVVAEVAEVVVAGDADCGRREYLLPLFRIMINKGSTRF
jgi:hypothetical protein